MKTFLGVLFVLVGEMRYLHKQTRMAQHPKTLFQSLRLLDYEGALMLISTDPIPEVGAEVHFTECMYMQGFHSC